MAACDDKLKVGDIVRCLKICNASSSRKNLVGKLFVVTKLKDGIYVLGLLDNKQEAFYDTCGCKVEKF